MTGLFFHPAFLWGLGFVAVPVILQIIFRMRYKRVRFAPLDFLLESQRRNRYRLLIEQLLLLLLRMMLIAAVVFLIARPTLGEHLAKLLAGNGQTEHYLLVDDSYSMDQNLGAESCFDRAKGVVRRLADELAQQSGRHALKVQFASESSPAFEAEHLDRSGLTRLQALLDQRHASFTAAPPWQWIDKFVAIAEQSDETAAKVFHLVSDFRTKDWSQTTGVLEPFQQLRRAGVQLHFVDAGGTSAANLAIAAVEARTSAPAVGVPLTLAIRVANHGSEPANNVSVTVRVDGRPLPVRVVEVIPAGEAATLEETVTLASMGPHQVSAELGADAILADNRRYWVADFLERQPVLLVDGASDRTDAKFVALALNPGSAVRTGWAPQIAGIEAINQSELSSYRTIILMNVASLDDAQARAVAEFVKGGGGIAFFAGDQMQAAALNKTLTRAVTPLLPVPLTSITQSPPPAASPGQMGNAAAAPGQMGNAAVASFQPDFVPEVSHPLFRIFAGDRNPFLDAVRIDQYFGVEEQETLPPTSRIVARHRSGAPLVIDSTLDAGRVLWFLTTASPAWNNWARNPSYVVTMLELQRYLAEPLRQPPALLVGEPWSAAFDAAKFRRSVTFLYPTEGEGKSEQVNLEATLDGTQARVDFTATERPGIYQQVLTTSDGRREVIARAFNVDPSEGDLQRITPSDLDTKWAGLDYRLETADQLSGATGSDRFDPRDALLAALVVILIVEQLLAWRMSHHPKG